MSTVRLTERFADAFTGLVPAFRCACGCGSPKRECGGGCGSGHRHSSCEIPEPCWMPEELGEVCTARCPGSVASLTIEVANEDFRSRSFTLAASGAAGGYVEFEPAAFALGPKEHTTVGARLSLPATSEPGLHLESIVWIRGCRDHFVRWTVHVADRERCVCRRIRVVDRPDYIHHWYDHFYCASGCRGARVGDGR